MILELTNSTTPLGKLYVVATPIGNLQDITYRAIHILREEISVIACEDTRQTQKLLQHYEIRKPLVSYHEHNEASRTAQVLEILKRGESVALVSDAGTPLISDPGFRLVQAAIADGITVAPIPGAAAFLTALAAAGLPTDEFRYIGFLPAKAGARRRALEALMEDTATIVAYESPHRVVETLNEMAEVMPGRPIVLGRELTKIHEEFLRGTAREIHDVLAQRESVKGEITLVIGRGERQSSTDDPIAEVRALQTAGMARMEAIKLAAKKTGRPKRELYRLLEEQEDELPADAAERDSS